MILCDKHCMPCCDFCIYALHEVIGVTPDGCNIIEGGPIDCEIHRGEE